jgi:hypothetical protein
VRAIYTRGGTVYEVHEKHVVVVDDKSKRMVSVGLTNLYPEEEK